MKVDFDEVPSTIKIATEVAKRPTVRDELDAAQQLLAERTTRCRIIKPLYGKMLRRKPFRYFYKLMTICPRFQPHHYCCKHYDNMVLDRDILSSREHTEFLATPKKQFGQRRPPIRHFYKAVIAPDCTARVAQLARPDKKRVLETLEGYEHVLKPRNVLVLRKHLQPPNDVEYTNIATALAYMEEERRLRRIAKRIDARRCKRLKRKTLLEKRKAIRKMVCTIFNEMRDFLQNDQYIVDEKSTLCEYILQQIRECTIENGVASANLHQYQRVLAGNLTVWINKLISGLNIQVKVPPQRVERPDTETFLPVSDYVSLSEALDEEGIGEMLRGYFEGSYEEEAAHGEDIVTEDTMQ